MPSAPDFTETQRAIIAHEDGPAAVLAGAGTGKTTVLAHRVHRLVADRGVAPSNILVSAFGRAPVDDLQSALQALGVSGVHTRTLHALGLQILRSAQPPPAASSPEAPDRSPAAQARRLAQCALRDVAKDRGIEPTDLGYSAPEVADRVATWKQALTYLPDRFEELPAAAQAPAQQCAPESDDLLALFHRFERHRRQRGWLTYADMVRSGWERLATDASLREALQSRYRFVLVDEFQDLSRAQVHLLDLLTADHRNYMAVGDEDQCIYGWRGADPSFLLDFRDRYDATEYRMTTSFRSPASALALANAVIAQNDERRPTHLRCTRGPTGRTELRTPADPTAEADAVAHRIETLHASGLPLHDVAVLVRTYGQTPPLERAFLERDLPYRLTGAAPFYERPAVRTLLQYLYWALLDRRRQRTGWFSTEQHADRYADRFAQILKRPTRYIPHRRIRRIRQEILRDQTSALRRLRAHRSALPDRTAERVDDFIAIARDLPSRLDDPPAETLDWLVDALDYRSHLRDTSAFSRHAEARSRAVDGLIQYARHHDTSQALLEAIRSLSAQQGAADSGDSAIDLRSIHRAKGREWPAVLLPGCVDGTLPLSSDSTSSPSTEEERRLLYVALTRSQEHLLISSPADQTRSPFLTDASATKTLQAVQRVRTGLTTAPDALSDKDVITLCQDLIRLHLGSYITDWWTPSEARHSAWRARLDDLRPAIATAQRQRQAYRQQRAEWTAHHQKTIDETRERLRSLREQIGTAPITATYESASPDLPHDASLRFKWDEHNGELSLLWDDHRVGILSPLDRHRLDPHAVLTLPWSLLEGRVERVQSSRQALTVRIDWENSIRHVDAQIEAPEGPPDPPSDTTRMLCSDDFQAGYTLLREALRSPSST